MRVTLSCGRSCSVRMRRVFFDEGELVGVSHAAGDVHQKDEIGGWQVFFGGVLRLDADFDEFGFALPGGIDGLGVDGEGAAVFGQGGRNRGSS